MVLVQAIILSLFSPFHFLCVGADTQNIEVHNGPNWNLNSNISHHFFTWEKKILEQNLVVSQKRHRYNTYTAVFTHWCSVWSHKASGCHSLLDQTQRWRRCPFLPQPDPHQPAKVFFLFSWHFGPHSLITHRVVVVVSKQRHGSIDLHVYAG